MTTSAAAERMVIGAVLRKPAVLRSVQAEITPLDFEDQRLGLILRGIVGLVARGIPVDYLTVSDNLAAWDVRGIDVTDLGLWADEAINPDAAPYYAAMIRERSVERQLVEIATRLGTPNGEDPGVKLANALEDLKALRDRGGSSAPLRTLGDLMDVPVEVDRYDWVIPGLMERRDRLMLTGGEGGGKSMLFRQLAICAAAGLHPFTFEQVQPARVLFIDVENSERQWRRTMRPMYSRAGAQGAADPRDTMSVHFESRLDITRASDLGRLHRLIDEAKPDIVALGPLYRLVPKAIKDDDDAAPVLLALDSLRDRDVALLIEAHSGHGDAKSGVRDPRPRGSSALLGWPEFGLGIMKPRRAGEPFELQRWRGDRDERNWPGELTSQRYTPQEWPWMPTGAYWASGNPGATLI